MKYALYSTLVVGLITGVVTQPASTAELPQFAVGHDRMEKLGAPNCSWPIVQNHLDVCQFQINALAYLAPFDDLHRLVKTLHEKEIETSIECAYFDWKSQLDNFSAMNPKPIQDLPRERLEPGVGRETALLEIKKMVHLVNAGGKPDIIVMDGPIRRLVEPDSGPFKVSAQGMPLDQAVEEIRDYMRAWREVYPEIEFVCITNFPNWSWKGYPAYRPDKKGHGDWFPCISKLVAAAKEAKIPLTAVRADNPYEYAMATAPQSWDTTKVDWMARILDLETSVEDMGLDFQMTINSHYGGMASAQGFYRETLKFLGEYRDRGGTPSLFMIHSWYHFPTELSPEDKPYTMTHLMKAVIEDFQGEAGARLARELAKPRPKVAHSFLDLAPPSEEDGNSHPDYPATGEWSYWTATGADCPVELGPEKVRYEPMRWNAKDGLGRGYEDQTEKGGSAVTCNHVERTQMVPHAGRTPVLRWTSQLSSKVSVAGTWWMSAPGNMHLVIYANGAPIVKEMGYTTTANPGLRFNVTVEVAPGGTIEFWADANGSSSYDGAGLRGTITPVR